MSEPIIPSIAVWLEPTQAAHVAAVARCAECRMTLAGTPSVGRTGETAAMLGCAEASDLRDLLVRARPTSDHSKPHGSDDDPYAIDFMWLDATSTVGDSPDDSLLSAMRDCISRGVRILTSVPYPSSVLDLARANDRPGVVTGSGSDPMDIEALATAGTAAWPEFFPRFRLTPAFEDARAILEDFGPVGSAHMQCFGSPDCRNAGASLIDSLDAIGALLGEPEEVYATFVPAPGQTSRTAAGKTNHASPVSAIDRLRDLSGTISANLRFSDGRAASIVASDSTGAWSRSLTLIGDGSNPRGGRLIIDSAAIEWSDRDGETLEPRRAKLPLRTAEYSEAVSAFADALSATGRRRAEREPPLNQVRVLSAAGAVLLSAATNEPESPQTIRRLVSSA